MNFSFCAPNKIIFGPGTLAQLPGLLGGHKKALVITGPWAVSGGLCGRVTDLLDHAGINREIYPHVQGEPTAQGVRQALECARGFAPDAVIGLGGGSAMDMAKAVSGLAVNAGDIVEYLEGVGTGRVMEHRPLFNIAIPTTAGTGAECTKNAVISDRDARYKRSFRDDRLMPDVALVDPSLGISTPGVTTAYAGMDALTQLIEAYISKKANCMTDALALAAIGSVYRALPVAYANGQDVSARTDMAYGAMVSGLCLANAGLGAVHGIAAALGAVAGVPHGLACAALLPHVMDINAAHCGDKTIALARCLGLQEDACAPRAAEHIRSAVWALMDELSIPKMLDDYAVSPDDMPGLLKAVSGGSMAGNPVEITPQETRRLIEAVLPVK